MYSKVMQYVRDYLQAAVTVMEIQTGYYGDFSQVNLAIPAVLLEPRINRTEAKSTRWNAREFEIRIWITIEMARDYMTSMEDMELLLGSGDPEDPDPEARVGIHAALAKLRMDDGFRALTGSLGGKSWRIGPKSLEERDTRFSIQQSASTRLNTAQVDITIHLESEK